MKQLLIFNVVLHKRNTSLLTYVTINKVKVKNKRKGTGGEGRDERGGGIQLP